MTSLDTAGPPSHTEDSQLSHLNALISSTESIRSPERRLTLPPLPKNTAYGLVDPAPFTEKTGRNSDIAVPDLSWDGVETSEINEDDSMFREEETLAVNYHASTAPIDCKSNVDGEQKKPEAQAIPISYADLSKKADLIIANAKKKLSLLEGNIKGARHSLLFTTPTTAESQEFPGPANTENLPPIITPEVENLRIFRASGIHSSRPRLFRSLQSLRKAKYSHNRIYSEPTVPTNSEVSRNNLEHIHDPLRNFALAYRRDAKFPVIKDEILLNRLPESIKQEFTTIDCSQSIATTRRLRSQAHELRNRLSFIRLHTHDGSLQKQTLQRFDPAAEADDIAILSQIQALEQSLQLEDEVIEQLENITPFSEVEDTRADLYRGFEGEGHRSVDSNINDEGSDPNEEQVYQTDLEKFEHGDVSRLLEQPHENRADAFDYEHFILHSGMGNRRSVGRSSSGWSTSSTPTAQGRHQQVVAGERSSETESEHSLDQYPGNDSFNSFASAAEVSDFDADTEMSDGQQSNLLHDDMDHAWPIPPSRSASALSGPYGVTPTQNVFPSLNGFQRSTIQRPVSAVLTALLSRDPRTSPVIPLTPGDTDLLYALADTLRNVCVRLQTNVDHAEVTVWRGRLEEARKVLSGEK